MSVIGEQPHRVNIPARRRPQGWPYDEHPEIETPGRRWPCGNTDGGFMFGTGAECRAADVLLEDFVGPPLYTRSHRRVTRRVESTHFETKVTGMGDDGHAFQVFTIPHPDGLW